MKEEIRRLLQATPFTPFAVDVAPDIAYSIATSDHANADTWKRYVDSRS